MRFNNPPRPTGSTPQAQFDKWVWDMLHASEIQESSTVKVERTTKGVRLRAAAPQGGGSSNSKPVWL